MPFFAATLYKVFGIHEIFGRLITPVLQPRRRSSCWRYFARRLGGSTHRGACSPPRLFAVYPGSVYYGRTFMPDTAMVFFLTAALYATTRTLLDRDRVRGERSSGRPALLSPRAIWRSPSQSSAVRRRSRALAARSCGGNARRGPMALLVAAPSPRTFGVRRSLSFADRGVALEQRDHDAPRRAGAERRR